MFLGRGRTCTYCGGACDRATDTENWAYDFSDVLGAWAFWEGSAEVMYWHRSTGPESVLLVGSEYW
jgi:hypothetical protein